MGLLYPHVRLDPVLGALLKLEIPFLLGVAVADELFDFIQGKIFEFARGAPRPLERLLGLVWRQVEVGKEIAGLPTDGKTLPVPTVGCQLFFISCLRLKKGCNFFTRGVRKPRVDDLLCPLSRREIVVI